MNTATPPAKGQSIAGELSFRLLHKSGKTFQCLHFRKTEENTAVVMVLAVLVDHRAVATSDIYYGDVSQPGRVLHNKLLILTQGDVFGQTSNFFPELGNLVLSLTTAGRAHCLTQVTTCCCFKEATQNNDKWWDTGTREIQCSIWR